VGTSQIRFGGLLCVGGVTFWLTGGRGGAPVHFLSFLSLFCLVDGWSWRARFLLCFFLNSVGAPSGGSFIAFVVVVSFLCCHGF
jgi:hypothetical protein